MSSKKSRNVGRVKYPASSPKQVPLGLRVRLNNLKESIKFNPETLEDENFGSYKELALALEVLKQMNLKDFVKGRV